MASEGGGDVSPDSEGQRRPKSEALDGPIPALRLDLDSGDGRQQASAGNSSLLGLSAKTSESPKPRDVLNREMYRIPSYAAWFSWGKIHTIERRALAEYFDGRSLSKTPKVYKEYREFIINKYRENPRRVLTFTEVRKMLVGDVNLIRKVFDFLEYWGLINHHVAPENKPQQVTAAAGKGPINHHSGASDLVKQLETVAESTVNTRSDAIPPGVQIVYPGSVLGPLQVGKPGAALTDRSVGNFPSINFPSYRDAFARPAAATVPVEAVGDSQSLDKSSDSQPGHDDWTMQEVLRLLEAIAKYGEDWNRVANHVGKKSKSECIMHFIKLPFGDQFTSEVGATPPNLTINAQNIADVSQKSTDLEHRDSHVGIALAEPNGSNENLKSVEAADEPPSKRNRITPLADSSNPILAQVAFLSAMVGPRVAAAAAQAAVAALAEEDPVSSQILSSSNQNAHAGHKDLVPISGSLATSKDSIKVEHGEDEDTLLGKGEHIQVSKDVETENGASKDPVISVTHVRAGLGMAIGAVAANAKLLADHEEREIEHIVASIIENQIKKLQSKVEHFEELEFLLEKEHLQIEKARAQVLADWIRYSHYHYNSGP